MALATRSGSIALGNFLQIAHRGDDLRIGQAPLGFGGRQVFDSAYR